MNNAANNKGFEIKSLLTASQAAQSAAHEAKAKQHVRTFYTMTGRGIVLDFSAKGWA